jgi:hypothetical protein
LVGLIRRYCKKERRTAQLISLLDRLRRNADSSARRTALPRDWSLAPDIVEKIIAEYRSGASRYQIAARHEIRRNTVRDVLKRSGFHLGVGREARLTAEQKMEIRARRAAGEGPTALAKAYGVSTPTIKRALLSTQS